MYDTAVVDAFHNTAALSRADLFPDGKLRPITAISDAEIAAPGWVGSDWKSGTLLVAINPGGGGDKYRRNPTDDELYATFRAFRAAQDFNERAKSLDKLSRTYMRVQQGHNIWRIVRPISEATGECIDELAFINILPFRTREDCLPSRPVMQNSWSKSAERQIRALKPTRIIALGRKAWDVMTRFELPTDAELILFKRGIGDTYIPDESKAVLTKLAAART